MYSEFGIRFILNIEHECLITPWNSAQNLRSAQSLRFAACSAQNDVQNSALRFEGHHCRPEDAATCPIFCDCPPGTIIDNCPRWFFLPRARG